MYLYIYASWIDNHIVRHCQQKKKYGSILIVFLFRKNLFEAVGVLLCLNCEMVFLNMETIIRLAL